MWAVLCVVIVPCPSSLDMSREGISGVESHGDSLIACQVASDDILILTGNCTKPVSRRQFGVFSLHQVSPCLTSEAPDSGLAPLYVPKVTAVDLSCMHHI